MLEKSQLLFATILQVPIIKFQPTSPQTEICELFTTFKYFQQCILLQLNTAHSFFCKKMNWCPRFFTMLHKHKQPFVHYSASYMRATSTVKSLSFWTVHPDKQCKLRSAGSIGISVIRVYTLAILSVHCRRIAITG